MPATLARRGRAERGDADRERGEVQRIEAHYSGPLPPAGQLQQYDQVVPGAAERLIAMVEEEQRHRHSVEREAVDIERERLVSIPKRGQSLAVFLALVLLGCAVYLFAQGSRVGGGAVLAVLTGGAVAGLAYGGRGRRE